MQTGKTVRLLHLILYRYMVERGYTARWIGKYKQDAYHIGNGTRFRCEYALDVAVKHVRAVELRADENRGEARRDC